MANEKKRRIYKYRAISGDFGRPTLDNAFMHHRLYWQSPKSFNDPFDCNNIFYFGDTPAERNDYIENHLGKSYPGNRIERRRHIKELKLQPHEKFAKVLQDQWPTWMAQSSMYCFTHDNNDLLMWAHYADSHHGVCLIFEESIDDNFYAVDVEYQTVRPRINICTMDRKRIMEVTLLTKSTHWEYEHECRIIGYRQQAGYKEFPRECLKGIILGANIHQKPEDEKYVMDLIGRFPRLEVYRAQVDEEHFMLNINRI